MIAPVFPRPKNLDPGPPPEYVPLPVVPQSQYDALAARLAEAKWLLSQVEHPHAVWCDFYGDAPIGRWCKCGADEWEARAEIFMRDADSADAVQK